MHVTSVLSTRTVRSCTLQEEDATGTDAAGYFQKQRNIFAAVHTTSGFNSLSASCLPFQSSAMHAFAFASLKADAGGRYALVYCRLRLLQIE